MALTANAQRNMKLHRHQLNALPVAAATVIFTGALVATQDADGLAVPASDAAAQTLQGVAFEGLDNSTGAAGTIPYTAGTDDNLLGAERVVRVDQVGEWEFTVNGADPKPGQTAYVVDDDTVSAAAGVNGVVAGRFTRPGNYGGWFVDVGAR